MNNNIERWGKVEIVGEYDVFVLQGPCHDFRVGRSTISDAGPMDHLNAVLRQKLHPARWKVHVKNDSHGNGTSASSLRQAAYDRQA